MVHSEGRRKVFFALDSNKAYHLEIIEEFLKNNFIVVLVCDTKNWESEELKELSRQFPKSLETIHSDFKTEKKAKALQNRLFEKFYPFDYGMTNLDQIEISIDGEIQLENIQEMIEGKLNSYFHFLKCLFPLFNSNLSFLFHIKLQEKSNKLGQYEPLVNVARESMLQTCLLENSDLNIQVGDLVLMKSLQVDKIFKGE